jgi:hypothetical protein
MLYAAFPSLANNLHPIATSHGLHFLELPSSLKVTWISTPELTETALSSILDPLNDSSTNHICVSFDAEWNFSRQIGVSIIQIAPHSNPDLIFIIPVHFFLINLYVLKFNPINQIHKFRQLPPSLLCLLISKQVFKIGSAIRGDITHLKHQFLQLAATLFFNIIDLKEYCINHGIITH